MRKANELRKLYDKKVLENGIEIKIKEILKTIEIKTNEYFNFIKNYDGQGEIKNKISFDFQQDIQDSKFNLGTVIDRVRSEVEKSGYKFYFSSSCRAKFRITIEF